LWPLLPPQRKLVRYYLKKQARNTYNPSYVECGGKRITVQGGSQGQSTRSYLNYKATKGWECGSNGRVLA
jgi:hypothetical protein